MRTAAPARETFTRAPLISAGRGMDLRLRPGDEGRKTIDAAGIGNRRLRLGLRLILRLRTMLALAVPLPMFARLPGDGRAGRHRAVHADCCRE